MGKLMTTMASLLVLGAMLGFGGPARTTMPTQITADLAMARGSGAKTAVFLERAYNIVLASPDSQSYLEQLNAFEGQFEPESWAAMMLLLQSVYFIHRNQPDQALDPIHRLLEMDAAGLDAIITGQARVNLGNYHMMQSQWDSARDAYLSAMEILQPARDAHRALSNLLQNLAYVEQVAQQYEAAREYLDASLAIAESHNIADLIADGLMLRSRLSLVTGDAPAAEADALAALAALDVATAPFEVLLAIQALSDSLIAQDRDQEALAQLENGIAIAMLEGRQGELAKLGRAIAIVHEKRGDLESALIALNAAFESTQKHFNVERLKHQAELEKAHQIELQRVANRNLQNSLRRRAIFTTTIGIGTVLLLSLIHI